MGGFFVLDKPAGVTSMTAVSVVRRRAGGVKTGHAGTLDPLATGVLVLALGKATRAISRITNTEKHYRTEIDLSAFTTTEDREGERAEVVVETPPTHQDIEKALRGFIGRIEQVPPAYSAVKVHGRRAYALARAGKMPEMSPRPITIHRLELHRYQWPIAEIAMHCDKGAYVRSLARDLGRVLGTGGHCASIRRTAVGPFTIEEATALDDVPDPMDLDMLIRIDEGIARVEKADRQ